MNGSDLPSAKTNLKTKTDENSRNTQNDTLELCSLRQFLRGEKTDSYKQSFLVLVTQDTLELNFTHRSSYGTQGEGDLHGEYENLAQDTLETLKNCFPEVFKEPQYPVKRGNDLDQIF